MNFHTSIFLFSLLLFVTEVFADSYLHNPRGSNNKLNEESNTVNNNRRLFDSQNNGNAGYQVGDQCIPNCLDSNGNYDKTKPGAGAGVMEFYEGSNLWIEWTNQHGMQSPFLHSNVVIQYMCDDSQYSAGLRDGKTTDKIPMNPMDPNYMTYGQHETYEYYHMCSSRRRNVNLYTADQNFNQDPTTFQDTAIHTRQDTNNNNDRYGFECPEERDYYPYWHPTPWRCDYYRSNSQNVLNKGNCSNQYYNNQHDCEYNGYVWTLTGAWNVPPPTCTACPSTRNNHNGNAIGSTGAPGIWWSIPYGIHADNASCVLRLRYNISTFDFDGWNIDKSSNNANAPVSNNGAKDYLGFGYNISGPLRLATATDQFGRTFQDRTHVFRIKQRPADANNWIGTSQIWNLNVQGRRGNIQQVYPAVEYDFAPKALYVSVGDYIHVQWTGSNANQAGNAGQGRDKTDRNNLVMVGSLGKNIPVNLNPSDGSYAPWFFTNDQSAIISMAFLNQTNCDPNSQDTQANNNCKVMNAAPAYYNTGLIRVDNPGIFNILSTRNNAFSNREQKGIISASPDWATIATASAITVGSIGVVSAMGIFLFGYAKRHPDSKLNKMLGITKPLYVAEFDELDQETEVPFVQKRSIYDRYPFLHTIKDWYEWEQVRIWYMSFFVLSNIVFWVYGFASNLNISPLPYFPYAKGFGKMLDLNCSMILIPVLRNFLSYIRTTAAGAYLPLDDNLKIHRWIAYTIVIAATGHITFHYLNFVFANNYLGIPTLTSAWGTLSGATGHLILFGMFLMYVTALIKRKIFRVFGRRYDGYWVFISTHKLYIPVYIMLILHSERFWMFALYPLLFLALEKFIQSRRARFDVTVVEANMVGKDVLTIKMRLSGKNVKKFRYKAGQYLFLNCVDLSEREWHPFTITSAPENDYFSVHIRCRSDMDWTYRLRQRFGFADSLADDGTVILAANKPITETENAHLAPKLKVDGPYGSASEEVFDFQTVILCGAGIGVTPFISVLKSISFRMKTQTALENQNMDIYFYWICRDQAEFNSFKDIFEELLANTELHGRLELNMYVTGELDLKKITQQKYNQFAGKPNWSRIMKEKAGKHEAAGEIGVFFCGPSPIAKDIAASCRSNSKEFSKTSKVTFKFHKENF